MLSKVKLLFHALIAFSLFSLLALLFIGSPDYYDSRTVKEIWESGHFVLFFMITMGARQVLGSLSLKVFFVGSVAFGFLFGLATEVLQLLVGRSFEWKDLINDLVGVFSALCLIYGIENKTKIERIVAIFSFVFFSLIGISSLIVSIYDDYIMTSQFPVLSNFETPFQLLRWDNAWAELSISKEIKHKGSNSMKVMFTPGKYPDITLNHFIHDWSNFQFIELSVFNPSEKSYELVFKIYDNYHSASQYEYSDRFNMEIKLEPGWNHLKHPLETVFQSPKNRFMNKTNIVSLSLFAIDVEESFVFYIDEVKLSN